MPPSPSPSDDFWLKHQSHSTSHPAVGCLKHLPDLAVTYRLLWHEHCGGQRGFLDPPTLHVLSGLLHRELLKYLKYLACLYCAALSKDCPRSPGEVLVCLLAVLLENTMYYVWRIMLWPSLPWPKHRGQHSCDVHIYLNPASQLLVKFITLQVTATVSSRGGNVRSLLRLLGSPPWF